MNEPQSLVEILRRASTQHRTASVDARERNLRRLLRSAMPAADVSDDLRRRVRALAAGESTPSMPELPAVPKRWGPFQRVFALPSRLPVWRVTLAVVCCALLASFFTMGRPIGVLARTLNAMAAVRSAHCTGWFYGYTDFRPDGSILPVRMREEWWYKAPDSFRREIGPEFWGTSTEPGVLIVKGQKGVFTSSHHATRGRKTTFAKSQLTRDLSPFDFFSPEGIVRRAVREKAASVSSRAGTCHGHRARILMVRCQEGASRDDWVLYVDPSSSLIMEARHDWYVRSGTRWARQSRDCLDRIEYNLSVPHGLF